MNEEAGVEQNGQNRRWPFAAGSGLTITGITVVLGAAVLTWSYWPNFLTVFFLALAAGCWLLILYFFRDPQRIINPEPGIALSPGDGTVVAVASEREETYLDADVVRISIFLSLMDVHVQRVPLDGRVTRVDHRPGRYLQAFKPEASQVNEAISMVVETAYGRILVRQIAGMLARRCVNYARSGEELCAGQRFGLIRFGSRVDLFLPPGAQVLVATGDKVSGGITPVARLQAGPS